MATLNSNGKEPVTPPRGTPDAPNNNNEPPPAPRHKNRGRVSRNGTIANSGADPSEGRALHRQSFDTSTMDRAVQSRAYQPQLNYGFLQDPPDWSGPPVVSGQHVPGDPFVSAPLAGGAPAFVPSTNTHQSGPPGPGSSSSPGGGPTGSESSNGRSVGNGNSNRSNSNGSSGGMSSARNNSAASNGQSSDGLEPVIVTTPHAGGKGKEAMRPQTPISVETRFMRVDDLHVHHFDEANPLGQIKGMQLFKEEVQKLGIFHLKPTDRPGIQTAFMFVDSLSGAKILFAKLRKNHIVKYISYETFRATDVKIPDTIDRFSSKVTFTVTLKGQSYGRRFSAGAVTEMAKTAAAKFGKIEDFDLADDTEWAQYGRMRYLLDFDSVGDANDIVHTLNPVQGLTLPHGTHEHLAIHAIGYDPVDANSPSGQASVVQTPSPRRKCSPGNDALDYSPTGRTATRKTANGKTAAVVGYVIPGKMAGPTHQTQAMLSNGQIAGQFARDIYQTFDAADMPVLGPDGNPHPAVAKPQDVAEWRIIQGYDVRTTLMVRNVPPEMTGADFVDMLRRTVPGEFDFAYNRIDFQKSQSVGYAFVNFTSTDALLRFVRVWRGKLLPHNIYRQHLRPCAVSYANTQGSECLVAKFRNSSILDEAKPCRPVLFWTASSARDRPELIGQEREWPPVDNASKKGRSVENAKISGLYTPRTRVNNGGRGGRRGGHTRFDRGTPAQQQEESPMANYNYQYGVGPAPAYGQYGQYAQPRFQPQPNMYNYNNGQFVPQMQHQAMMYPPPQFQMPPMMQPQVGPAQGPLRTHTNGDLGYRHPVMPAALAPVNNPTEGQESQQDQFQPLLYPVKGQVPEYYRSV